MAINRETLKKQVDTVRATRGSGKLNFLKKKGSQTLRILEFVDEDGNNQFARQYGEWNPPFGQQGPKIINRQHTFGATDAPSRLREICDENGQDFPFQLRKQFLVNAIDVNANPLTMKVYVIPVSVWEQIVDMLITDQWADVLEQNTGHAFIIDKQGSGLDTTYSCVPDRKPSPVSAKLMETVVDPLSVVDDPGVMRQCELLGTTIDELYGESAGDLQDIEPIMMDVQQPSPKATAKTSAKTVLGGGKGRQQPVQQGEEPEQEEEQTDDEQGGEEDEDARLPLPQNRKAAAVTAKPKSGGGPAKANVGSLVSNILKGRK